MLAHRLAGLARLAFIVTLLAGVACDGRAPRAGAPDDPPGDVGTGGGDDGAGGDGGDGSGDGSGDGGDGSGDGGDGSGDGGDGSGDGGDGGGEGDALRVAIDVRPGEAGAAPVQPGARGKIPVALLGAPGFDVASVELASLRFAGAPVARLGLGGPMAALEDVDGDGRDDLVCHFEVAAMALAPAAATAALEGRTVDGTPFRGEDAIRLVP